ncbi:MAG: hypothetical protein IIB66_11440, partial [Proteobacteria bacterium]|nr:hypothetical protein [Pseudomonadota bacterium]
MGIGRGQGRGDPVSRRVLFEQALEQRRRLLVFTEAEPREAKLGQVLPTRITPGRALDIAKPLARAPGQGQGLAQAGLLLGGARRHLQAMRRHLDGTLLLPVESGSYLRGWGSGQSGYHLAVDIGAPTGTTVLAAERGIVGYACRRIRGYGHLVVI